MPRLTIQQVMLIILFVLLLTLATRIPVDTDTWWHLRSAEYTLNNGMIYNDPFSHTFEGEQWINHSWGAQLIMYVVWNIGGNLGLALYTSILATGGMAFLYRISAGNTYSKAFVMVLGAATAAVFWSARPQMLSFFLSTVILYLLYVYKREGIDRLWLIPVVMALWGNLHAGYSIGFIFIGAVIVGEILNNLFNRDGYHVVDWAGVRKLIMMTFIAVAALVINPNGFDTLLVPFQTVSIGSLREFIQEWNSPNFQGRETWGFILIVIGLIGLGWGSRLKFDWSSFLLVSGTLFMALLAGRNIAVFAVVAVPVITYLLDDILTRRGWVLQPRQKITPMMARVNLLLVVVTIVGALVYVLGIMLPDSVREAQEDFLPVLAAEYLNEQDFDGEMFNSYNWGGYLMFAAPQYKVYVDGRTDLYTEFVQDWLNTALGNDGWREALDEHDIKLVVVENGSGLDTNLREEAGWQLEYEDELAVIHVRTGGGS